MSREVTDRSDAVVMTVDKLASLFGHSSARGHSETGHLMRASYVRAFLALGYESPSVITTLALGLPFSEVRRNLCAI
jgi:hypothetical protein